MAQEITGYFNGEFIIPDQTLTLKHGQRVKIWIEASTAEETPPLQLIRELATDMGRIDLSINHKQISSPESDNGD